MTHRTLTVMTVSNDLLLNTCNKAVLITLLNNSRPNTALVSQTDWLPTDLCVVAQKTGMTSISIKPIFFNFFQHLRRNCAWMSTGNTQNFKALLLAVNGPRDGHSKHHAPSTAIQIVHADGNDSVIWGQSQTMRYKSSISANLILKPTAAYLDVYNTYIIFQHDMNEDVYIITTY